MASSIPVWVWVVIGVLVVIVIALIIYMVIARNKYNKLSGTCIPNPAPGTGVTVVTPPSRK